MLRQALRRAVQRFDRRFGTDILWAQQLARRVTPKVSSGRARAKVFGAALLLGTQHWRRPIRLRLDGPEGPIPFTVPDYSAYKVLHEIFYGGEYDLDLGEPPRSILDLGGHVGASVLFFRRRWPSAKVTVVEANPELVPLLRENVRGLEVDVRHAAVSARDGQTGFRSSGQSWSGQKDDAGTDVPAVALDHLLEQPVDLLKIDIEGAEFEALANCSRIGNARVIVGEIHANPGTRAAQQALGALEGFDVDSRPDGTGLHTLFRARRVAV